MAVRITGAGVALTVGIILVSALLVGGLLWAKHQGEVARHDDAVKVAQENLEKQSGGDVALNDGDKSNSSSNSSNGSANSTNGGSASTNNSSNSTQPAHSTASEMPHTGPADTLGTIIALASVTFVGMTYLSSKQKLRDLL